MATEEEMVEALEILLDARDVGDGEARVRSVRSFDDAGIGRFNYGVVVDLTDGTQFQLTIVRSR